jgi:phosphoglycerate kinase
MRLRSIKEVKQLEGKRVLVRIDANVQIVDGRAYDGENGRIAKACEGLSWLMNRKARVIVLSHLGRPKSSADKSCRLAPVAARLSKRLGVRVLYDGSLIGPKAEALLARLAPGGVALLENVRFDKREEENDPAFAQALAAFGDLYVNDAFSVSHRAHASVAEIQKLLPSYAGPLLVREIAALDGVVSKPKHPFVLLLGGAKMKTKIGLIEHLGPNVDRLFIGGALANTFLAAKGLRVGKSLYEKDQLKIAADLLKRFGKKIVLPVEVRVVADIKKDHHPRTVAIGSVKSGDIIVDVEPRSMRPFLSEMRKAKTVVWNGPFGLCEVPAFSAGTCLLARAVAAMKNAVTIVGGGDTEPIVEALGIAKRFTLLSTGGGAMLAFLAGEKLPGVEPLIVRR